MLKRNCIESMLDDGIHRSIGHSPVETLARLLQDLANGIAKLRDRIGREGINNIDLGLISGCAREFRDFGYALPPSSLAI
ncbi:hypothetical protein MPLB_1790015 [Mesorhizobium sp. ORS 3324]|nr:hypothetical protein MPLB_1790015 [Mesorhizobium sp. ORS 3324]